MNNPDKNDVASNENEIRPERPSRNPGQKPSTTARESNDASRSEPYAPRAPMPTERERERAENEGMPSIKPEEEPSRS